MAELVVVGFDEPNEADRALTELARLQKEYLVDLEDAVVAIRGPDGKLRLKQSVDLVGGGAASGGLWGAMWGPLVGLLFLNPLLGLATGAALGAGAGALSGSLADYGINDGFIRSIAETLQPNTSALFVLVRKAQPEKVMSELSRFRGRVIRSSLSPEQEARLQAALSGSAVTPARHPEHSPCRHQSWSRGRKPASGQRRWWRLRPMNFDPSQHQAELREAATPVPERLRQVLAEAVSSAAT